MDPVWIIAFTVFSFIILLELVEYDDTHVCKMCSLAITYCTECKYNTYPTLICTKCGIGIL